MTDTRYFYTDPLAAAWMATHFGIKIDQTADEGTEPVEKSVASMLLDLHSFPRRRCYVDPGSLHLLEPIEADQGVDEFGSQVAFKDGCWWRAHPVASSADEVAIPPVTIDKRNGIPFMWPESDVE